MLRWICVTMKDKIRNEHVRGSDSYSSTSDKEDHREKSKVVRNRRDAGRRARAKKNVTEDRKQVERLV